MTGLSTHEFNQVEGAQPADLTVEGAPETGPTNESNSSTQPPDGPVTTKRKITRSRIGCFTCRRRKKACDLGKPVCQGCTRLGLECQWPMNYQDTLPKKRVAEALAAADRAGGRSETLGSVNRSRSGSRSRIRDLKHEPNASSPAERTALHRGDSGSTSRVSNEQGHSPPSRRLSVAGSVYEDDSWLFPERMSYIHGDPEDMFDIYDDSPAPLAASQQTAVYGQQHAIPQNFTSHLQHRFSGPGFGQLYSNGQSHPSMLHQTGQSNANHFSVAQIAAVDLNNQIALGYGDSLNRISQNAGPNSALGFAPVAKGFSNGQSHNNTLVTPLSSTGLALTVDHPYNNQHSQHQNQHLQQSNADASVNIGHLELNKNLEWTHSSNGGPSAPVNLEDPLMQLLAGGSYHPLHADAPASARLYQTQRSDNSRMPSQDQNHCTTAPSTSVQRLPPSISARDFESSFQPLDPLSAEKSLWSGQNDDQHGLRTQILEYYTHTLSKLVSCDHVDQEERHDAAETAPGARRAAGFDVFRSLVSSSTTLLERTHGDSSRTSLPESRIHHPSSSISGVSPELNPAHILHMALLAWSGRHSLNRGEARHEAASEDWGKRAEAMLARLTDGKEEQTAKRMRQIEKHPSGSSAEQVEGNGSQGPDNRAEIQDQGGSGHVAHVEPAPLHGNPSEASRLTTLATCLMIVQWKNCRGDISGFQSIMARVKALSTKVFFPDQKRPVPGTMEFHFMENLLYKDVLSTSIYVNEPILDQAALQSYFRQQPTVINTLTGLAWPVFTTMYRIAGLIRKKRERASASARKGNAWNYDELVDLVSEAEKIQQDLDTEKRLIDEVIEKHPRLEVHRCLHEAFRLTSVLQLRCQVLNEPSTSLPIRLLIRQLLGLLESMMKQNLPGWCSCHWVQFQTALYCLDIKCENEQSDRDRINILYDRTFHDLAFLNVPRSHKVVQEVWRRSDAEGRQVDWLDVVQEWDWDLYFV